MASEMQQIQGLLFHFVMGILFVMGNRDCLDHGGMIRVITWIYCPAHVGNIPPSETQFSKTKRRFKRPPY